MCVIIYLPKTKNVTNKTLKQCWRSNPDSVGYMYASKGQVTIKKFLTLRPFIKQYRKDLNKFGNTSDFVVHFRIATSGLIDLDNCHPFAIGADHAFVHNGVISGYGNKQCSDTNKFRDQVLEPLAKHDHKFLDCDQISELIEDKIGMSNKFVIMRKDGKIRILNEKQGHWKDGIWFSNLHWDYSQFFPNYDYDDYNDDSWPHGNSYHDRSIFGNKDFPPFKKHGNDYKQTISGLLHHDKGNYANADYGISGLPKLACSGCGEPTISQDAVCNTCWRENVNKREREIDQCNI